MMKISKQLKKADLDSAIKFLLFGEIFGGLFNKKLSKHGQEKYDQKKVKKNCQKGGN